MLHAVMQGNNIFSLSEFHKKFQSWELIVYKKF